MKRLLLVRHGETVWNSERRLQGQEDIPLSARGIEQARSLAPVVRAFAPATVVASDLKRAHQTAEALGYGACKLDERLREAHLGAWVGLRAADLLREEPASYLAWREGTLTPPEGESFEQLQVRTLAVLQDVLREPGEPHHRRRGGRRAGDGRQGRGAAAQLQRHGLRRAGAGARLRGAARLTRTAPHPAPPARCSRPRSRSRRRPRRSPRPPSRGPRGLP